MVGWEGLPRSARRRSVVVYVLRRYYGALPDLSTRFVALQKKKNCKTEKEKKIKGRGRNVKRI